MENSGKKIEIPSNTPVESATNPPVIYTEATRSTTNQKPATGSQASSVTVGSGGNLSSANNVEGLVRSHVSNNHTQTPSYQTYQPISTNSPYISNSSLSLNTPTTNNTNAFLPSVSSTLNLNNSQISSLPSFSSTHSALPQKLTTIQNVSGTGLLNSTQIQQLPAHSYQQTMYKTVDTPQSLTKKHKQEHSSGGSEPKKQKRPTPPDEDEELVGEFMVKNSMECYKKIDGKYKATLPQLKQLAQDLNIKIKGNRNEIMAAIVVAIRSLKQSQQLSQYQTLAPSQSMPQQQIQQTAQLQQISQTQQSPYLQPLLNPLTNISYITGLPPTVSSNQQFLHQMSTSQYSLPQFISQPSQAPLIIQPLTPQKQQYQLQQPSPQQSQHLNISENK